MPIGDRSTWGPALRDAAERPAWWFRGDLAAGDGPGEGGDGAGDGAGGDPPDPTGGTGEPDPTDDDSGEPEAEAGLSPEVKAVLAKERQARKDADKRARDATKAAKDATDALAAKETAELSELEQAQRRAEAAETERDEARKEARATALRFEVATQGAKLNLHDPEVAMRLLDESAIEYDAEGKPSNVEALLKALAKDHPYLVKPKGGHIELTPDGDGTKPLTPAEISAKAGNRLHRVRL